VNENYARLRTPAAPVLVPLVVAVDRREGAAASADGEGASGGLGAPCGPLIQPETHEVVEESIRQVWMPPRARGMFICRGVLFR